MNKHIFVAACAFLTLARCGDKAKAPEPPVYAVTSPLVRDTFNTAGYVAEILARQHVEVRSRVNGYMERLHVDEGEQVKEGQLLFTIGSVQYEMELQKAIAALKNAMADLKVAEVEYNNVKSLRDKNIVSQAELDVTHAKLDALKADVEEAEAHRQQAAVNLSFTRIKAPFAGVINRIPRKVGSLISEGDVLTSISDNSEVFAYFHLSETDYLSYIDKQEESRSGKVDLLLANNTVYGHRGTVEATESEFDQSTGNIAFRARFPNPEGVLKHGSNGKIMMKKRIKKAILVPMKSTFEIQDRVYLFVVKPDSTLAQRQVMPVMRIPHYYVLSRGLLPGDRFLLDGVQNVRAADKVSPQYKDPDAVVRDQLYL